MSSLGNVYGNVLLSICPVSDSSHLREEMRSSFLQIVCKQMAEYSLNDTRYEFLLRTYMLASFQGSKNQGK